MLYEDGPNGTVVTGLRMAKAGKEQIVKADAYVAALDVPGAKRLVPQVRCARRAVPCVYFAGSLVCIPSQGLPGAPTAREGEGSQGVWGGIAGWCWHMCAVQREL